MKQERVAFSFLWNSYMNYLRILIPFLRDRITDFQRISGSPQHLDEEWTAIVNMYTTEEIGNIANPETFFTTLAPPRSDLG